MFKLVSSVFISYCFLIIATFANANTGTNIPASITSPNALNTVDTENIKKALSEKIGLEIESVATTPMAGVIEIVTPQGVFYTDIAGAFLIQGKLFGLGETVTNYTEQTLVKLRIQGMKTFENDMIVYKAANEKHTITVFTDISCGYCRKMHQQIDEYNKQGITVRYLAYPRNGIVDYFGNFTEDFQNLRSVWCNENPATALTKAKSGGSVPLRICEKPIEAEFAFGRQIGVNGTPAIMLSNGFMLPGYKSPSELIEIFDDLQLSVGK